MNKYIALILFQISTICAMDSPKEISAQLTVQPYESLMYAPFVQNMIKKYIKIQTQDNDPVVEVTLLDLEGNELHYHYPGEIPEYFPISLLKDKKEGDVFEVLSTKNRKIRVTCTQKPFSVSDNFETRLKVLLRKFKDNPNYHLFDEKRLIKKGVIKIDDQGEFHHGPKGYNFKVIDK